LAKASNWLTKKLYTGETKEQEKKRDRREGHGSIDEVYGEAMGHNIEIDVLEARLRELKGEPKNEEVKNIEQKAETSVNKYDIPLDSGLLMKYGKENFGFFQVADIDTFKKIWDKKGYEEHFGQYAEALIKSLIKDKSQGLIYSGSVVSVLTNGGQDIDILTKLITVKTGKEPLRDELLAMPFSEVAKEYLNLDVEKIDKDYFKHFRK